MGRAAPASVSGAFRLRPARDRVPAAGREIHVIRKGIICDTDTRGYATPRGRSLAEIVLDASEGFIPLWARNVTLRWRFQERSLTGFADPAAAKSAIESLFGEALLAWGSASPVRFSHRTDGWEFEIVTREGDRCNAHGCVVASAFFPHAGRHELVLYIRDCSPRAAPSRSRRWSTKSGTSSVCDTSSPR
jgi:hypothetical protein